jgi:hypothetical protein
MMRLSTGQPWAKKAHAGDDRVRLRIAQARIAGQRQHLGAGRFGDGQRRRRAVRPDGLAMVGDGVVHVAGDAQRRQVGLQRGAARRAHDVQVHHVLGAGRGRAAQGQVGQRGAVARGDGAAARVGRIQARQLGRQHGGLQLVQAAVDAAGQRDLVLAHPAVLAQRAQALGQRRVRRHHRAAVAQGAQVLGGVEAEAAQPPPAGAAALKRGAVRLGAVLDQRHAGLPAQGVDGRHGGHLPVQVGDDDGGHRAGRQRGGQRVGRHRQAWLVDVDPAHVGAHLGNGGAAGAAGVGHRQHALAGAHAQRRARAMASVPLATPTACSTPTWRANAASKPRTAGPSTYQPLSATCCRQAPRSTPKAAPAAQKKGTLGDWPCQRRFGAPASCNSRIRYCP